MPEDAVLDNVGKGKFRTFRHTDGEVAILLWNEEITRLWLPLRRDLYVKSKPRAKNFLTFQTYPAIL